jgi:hypothetical protein
MKKVYVIIIWLCFTSSAYAQKDTTINGIHTIEYGTYLESKFVGLNKLLMQGKEKAFIRILGEADCLCPKEKAPKISAEDAKFILKYNSEGESIEYYVKIDSFSIIFPDGHAHTFKKSLFRGILVFPK